MSSLFVLDSPGGLSSRAREFLASSATRVNVDLGLTGEALRDEMARVYGSVDEVLLRTLADVQGRYAGLSYSSGFFNAIVKFAPSFDPDPDDDELEILYAVETGSVSGASLTKFGEVEVGVDAAGLIEFSSLDVLIESDAMFALAAARPMAKTVYLDRGFADPVAVAAMFHSIRLVPEACGRRTWWFTGASTDVFYCSIWHDLGFGLPPFVKVWTSDSAVYRRFEECGQPS